MNIVQAKRQIENAVRAYLAKDELGAYRIPQRMQRPIVIFGPPGVGKTAIVAQVADEMGINFLSYSITHHTRQSALGLPFITAEEFDGQTYNVADYTMSEIIAAVHRARKESGIAQGILFLDEVNCASETLMPSMLQFLQFKTFGMHRLPDGWTIVCAGNPPEYNRTAREFDPAILDRVKRIDVEADVEAWQEYALLRGVHPAVTTFLEAKPSSFYLVRTGIKAPRLVTARGWEDLSRILQAYEEEGIEPDVDLVGQYLQDEQTAREFFSYYDLFRKYQDDYKVSTILNEGADEALIERAASAPFDERLAVVGLLLDSTLARVHENAVRKDALGLVRADIKGMSTRLQDNDFTALLNRRIEWMKSQRQSAAQLTGATETRELVSAEHLALLERISQLSAEADEPFEEAKAAFNGLVDDYEANVRAAMGGIDHAFAFLDAAFGEQSQEALVMVTKLSTDSTLVAAVAEHGCEGYLKHNKNLLVSERGHSLIRQIEELENL